MIEKSELNKEEYALYILSQIGVVDYTELISRLRFPKSKLSTYIKLGIINKDYDYRTGENYYFLTARGRECVKKVFMYLEYIL